MLMDVEASEQAEPRSLEFLLSESFRKFGFDWWSGYRFTGFVLDDRDAAARTQNRAQASKVLNAIFDVVIGIDQQYEIEAGGRQMGRGERR